jgi:hypothetical protein
LLERNADVMGQLFLADAQQGAPQLDAAPDMDIDRVRRDGKRARWAVSKVGVRGYKFHWELTSFCV